MLNTSSSPPGPGGPPGPGYLNPNANVTVVVDDDDGTITHANTLAIFAFSTLVSFLM